MVSNSSDRRVGEIQQGHGGKGKEGGDSFGMVEMRRFILTHI